MSGPVVLHERTVDRTVVMSADTFASIDRRPGVPYSYEIPGRPKPAAVAPPPPSHGQYRPALDPGPMVVQGPRPARRRWWAVLVVAPVLTVIVGRSLVDVSLIAALIALAVGMTLFATSVWAVNS